MLTLREECFLFTLDGFTAKGIAENLGLSKRTVEAYLDSVRTKLKVNKKSELIRFARDKGYIKNIEG